MTTWTFRTAISLTVPCLVACAAAVAQSDTGSAATLFARAGYTALPFTWLSGGYPSIAGKVDTTRTDLVLDTGMNGEIALESEFEQVSGVHPIGVSSTTAGEAGNTSVSHNVTVDRVMMGPVTFGPLLDGRTGRLPVGPVLIGSRLLGAYAAIFDFVTDTLYIVRGDSAAIRHEPSGSASAATAPVATVRAALEAAGQYRTFLALMKTAGLLSILDQPPGGGGAPDSLAWIRLSAEAIRRAGTDSVVDEKERLRLTAEATNRSLRARRKVTVFAPTDAAFARLTPAALRALRANRSDLTAILRAHILTDANIDAGSLRTLVAGASQPGGSTLGFHRVGPKLIVDRLASWNDGSILARATIVQPDLTAANGVAHGIDHLLTPSAKPTALQTALGRRGYVTIPLYRHPGGAYVLQAHINGSPAMLMIDTGAPTGVVLDRDAVKRMKGVSPWGWGSVPLALGNTPPLSVDFALINLSAVNQKIARQGMATIDGLIGSQFLKRYGARFDLGAGTLYLHPGETQQTP